MHIINSYIKTNTLTEYEIWKNDNMSQKSEYMHVGVMGLHGIILHYIL